MQHMMVVRYAGYQLRNADNRGSYCLCATVKTASRLFNETLLVLDMLLPSHAHRMVVTAAMTRRPKPTTAACTPLATINRAALPPVRPRTPHRKVVALSEWRRCGLAVPVGRGAELSSAAVLSGLTSVRPACSRCPLQVHHEACPTSHFISRAADWCVKIRWLRRIIR